MKKSRTFTYVSVALMGVLLILHFIPFWNCEGTNASIQSYIWFPFDYPQMQSYFSAQLGDKFSINGSVVMPILVLVLTVLGIFLCYKKKGKPYTAWISLACGIVGAVGYITTPVYRLGSSWILHLLVCVAMIIVSGMTLMIAAKED